MTMFINPRNILTAPYIAANSAISNYLSSKSAKVLNLNYSEIKKLSGIENKKVNVEGEVCKYITVQPDTKGDARFVLLTEAMTTTLSSYLVLLDEDLAQVLDKNKIES